MIRLKNILLEKVKKGSNFTIHPRTANAVNGLQMELDAAFPNDKIKFSSGYRDEYNQARVVYKNWKKHGGANGGREYLVGLYTDDEIANAISDAYEAGSTEKKSIDLAKQVLDDFKSRGKYMSRHQQGNAVDISARSSIQQKVKDWINAGNSKFAESVLDEEDHLHVRLVVNASAPTESDIDVVPVDSTTAVDTPTSDLELRRQTKYTQNIEKVKEVQRPLIILGYDLGPYGPIGDGEDGILGPYTTEAIKSFQQDYFNDSDKWTGIADKETKITLAAIVSNESKVSARQALNRKSDQEISLAIDDYEKTYDVDDEIIDINITGVDNPPSSVTSGVIGRILDLIAKHESGRKGYDAVNPSTEVKGLSTLPIKDAWKLAKSTGKSKGGSGAMGRYQQMPNYLRKRVKSSGLDFNNDTFDPRNQDKLAIALLNRRGLKKWMANQISNEEFANNLSMEWAALATPAGFKLRNGQDSDGNTSYYAGIGGNKAGISADKVIRVLNTA